MQFRSVVLAGIGLTCLAAPLPTALAAEPEALAKEVDLRPEYKKIGLSPLAQGKRDVCSLFAVTSLAEFELAKSSPIHPQRLSEEFLIWGANAACGLKGDQAMFVEAVQGLTHLGICTSKLMPYSDTPDPHRAPDNDARADAGHRRNWSVHWIKRWNVNTGLTSAQMHDIKHELAHNHPVAIGMRWPKNLHLNRQHVATTPPPAQVEDGHSVVLAGYRDDPEHPGGGLFILRNSFGPTWGDEGYAYFPFAYIAEYGNDALTLRYESPAAERLQHGATFKVEGESLKVIEKHRCRPVVQDMHQFGAGLWSEGKQLFLNAESGAEASFEFAVKERGKYDVDLDLTLGPDFGRLRVTLDGNLINHDLDGFCGRVEPSGPLTLGTFDLKSSVHVLKISVVGKDENSKGFNFGIDAIELIQRK
jgi:Papain family cysteine protease